MKERENLNFSDSLSVIPVKAGVRLKLQNSNEISLTFKLNRYKFRAWLAALLFPSFSFADSSSFPLREITVQVFNFSVFAIVLFFLVRKPIKLFFHKRQEEFFSFEKQSARLEREKKKELEAWEKKLEILKEQKKYIQKKAQSEGEKVIFQRREEIKNLQNRLKKEAEFFLQLEKEKLRRELLKKWKDKITQKAGQELDKQAKSSSFQQERFRDFLKQMESRL